MIIRVMSHRVIEESWVLQHLNPFAQYLCFFRVSWDFETQTANVIRVPDHARGWESLCHHYPRRLALQTDSFLAKFEYVAFQQQAQQSC